VAYTVEIVEQAKRELQQLPKRFRVQIRAKIQSLANDPFPPAAKALQGPALKGLYRIRSGDYRIIYQVRHNQLRVLVVRIGNRKDIYD
jgi:mRNA interferase RelE/StbE